MKIGEYFLEKKHGKISHELNFAPKIFLIFNSQLDVD